MSYYLDLKNTNLILMLRRMLKSGLINKRDSDGKFYTNFSAAWDTPWVHVKSNYESNCFLWKDVTFEHICKLNFPKHQWFVPAGCQNCFKVVVRPQNLKQLFALEQLQERLHRASKCGIEVRPEVFGNYGGYFYNRGLPDGVQCYKDVRKAVSKDRKLGKDIPVILKRGCTEMEHGCGPSDQWIVKPGQLELEMKIANYFVGVPVLRQTDDAKDSVRQSWIERAYSVGDETSLEYNDGNPLYPEYVAYHHLAEGDKLKKLLQPPKPDIKPQQSDT